VPIDITIAAPERIKRRATGPPLIGSKIATSWDVATAMAMVWASPAVRVFSASPSKAGGPKMCLIHCIISLRLNQISSVPTIPRAKNKYAPAALIPKSQPVGLTRRLPQKPHLEPAIHGANPTSELFTSKRHPLQSSVGSSSSPLYYVRLPALHRGNGHLPALITYDPNSCIPPKIESHKARTERLKALSHRSASSQASCAATHCRQFSGSLRLPLTSAQNHSIAHSTPTLP